MGKNLFTRICALVLSVVLVCTCMPMSALATAMEETTPTQDVVIVDEQATEATTAPATEATTAPTQTTETTVAATETTAATEPVATTEATIPPDVEIPDDDGGEGPDKPEGDDEEDMYANAIEVTNAEQLAEALSIQEPYIRITADFALDRTFYVTANTVIFTKEAHTLTRDPSFGGDIFVVGENALGEFCENPVTLTLGDPNSEEKNLLVIDGNKDNMNADVPVTGSVLFVVSGASVELHENITITNNQKVGNEKTLTELYGVSYAGRVGGAMAIITSGASMTIYGGTYTNNFTNDITDDSTEEGQVSAYGGAIFAFGALNIYGGLFQGNHAARGGAIYVYRTTKIYNAQFVENSASTLGGAIYMPSSTSAYLYLGGENSHAESDVLFQGNTATGGGAIYARNKLDAKDTRFIGNSATSSQGGAISAGSMELILTDCVFDGNSAARNGGAIYHTGLNSRNAEFDLSIYDCVLKNNTATASGGAIYMSADAAAYVENTDFANNTAGSQGGAILLSSTSLTMDGGSFTENTATDVGGAIALLEGASAKLGSITATKNHGKSGGFMYVLASQMQIFDSYMAENTSTSGGGAIYLGAGAYGGVYATTFHGNVTDANGGGLFVYTDGYTNENKLVVHSCIFTNNQADYGGAIYASNRSVIDLYNTTAKYNSALKGGFLYHTTTNTIINLAALTLQGNTATDGGPIIWGNSAGAKLYLDKALWLDKDQAGDLDDAYWAAAIYNSLKVYDTVIDIPNYVDFNGVEIVPELPRIPISINSSEELEKALSDGRDLLRIDADFQIDRTFYIYRKTTIYSLEAHTLTRAPGFAGDIFVVGENADGTLCENEVVLTLGDPESKTKNLLTIDGNKDNLTATVTGSVLFIVEGACADIYENVTFQNHKKLGNEKTLTENYGVSYVNQVGGAVAIIAKGAFMNIYGGSFTNNAVNDEAGGDSCQGGAIYNFGKLNIYGGTFEGNSAARGGVIYCYRTTNIYNAQLNNNSASTLGGAIYMPSSTAAILNIGLENELVESSVTFDGNTAATNGGAIYAANKITMENTTFTANSAKSGGAIISNNAVMTLRNCSFTENTASTHGGAIYVNGHNTLEKETDLTVTDCSFTSNTSTSNGGAIYMNGTGVTLAQNSTFTQNTAAAGGAIYSTNGTLTVEGGTLTENAALTGAGGAIALYTNSVGVLSKVTISKNHTDAGVGGGIFVKNSSLTMYRSTLQENTSASNGGGLHMDAGATGSIYDTDFIKNTAASNGGGVFLYTNTTESEVNPVLMHSCDFTQNSGAYGGAIYASSKAIATFYNTTATGNSAIKGGFLYETTTGTTLTMVGVTVSGNTATDGGPIIWGNSTGAVLNLDKGKYTDLGHTGTYDSAYWKTAIVNKLTVNDISQDIPGWLDYQEEAYDHMASAIDVASAQQLEDAIASGAAFIRVIADFEIDRTFYITGSTTIFSTLPRTLTRAPGFGGDMFVVGENAEGKSALLLGGVAKLTLGNPLSTQENMLVIDGNKDNMTVPVVGSALFITYSSVVDLHAGVTFCNAYKSGNERTYNPNYALAIANRIGGPLAVVASGTLNIYGGNYRNNAVNEELSSAEEDRISTTGGLIHNYSNVNIYGGVFENNQSARGGVVYNYKVLKVYGGSFIGNTASCGGVFYAPNTPPSHTHIGSADADGAKVLFRGNSSSVSHGGVIYSSALCTLVIHGNTTFEGNHAAGSGGAICSYGQLTANNVTFSENTAEKYGGAVYAANNSATYVTRYNSFTGCTFKDNQATQGGALAVYSGSKEYDHGGIAVVNDCTFNGNIAASLISKTASSNGGAIYVERKSTLTLVDSVLKNNSARTEGGAIYAGGGSTLNIVDSKFNQNAIMEKGKHGGAISIHSVTLNLTGTTFTGNKAISQAGALYISYASALDRNSEVFISGGSFTSNTTEGLGGAIYATKRTVTEDKRVLTVSGTSFSKNAAKEGGAMCFSGGSTAYMTDTTFTSNQTTEGKGGAIYVAKGNIELDTATFSKNAAVSSGGAFAMEGGSATLYNITATGNKTEAAGGFGYSNSSTLTVYDSTIQNNTSVSNGGGMALYAGAVANVYNTSFESNTAEASGGGLFMYTDGAEVTVHSCSFTGNQGGNGGAIYASNKTIGKLYNITATNNTSTKGGFLYETTTGTELTLVGATVSGNTATSGGPIIWGNSTGAVLNIDKAKFTDNDQLFLTSAYWSDAIVNKLTVNEITEEIPAYEPYVSQRDTGNTEPSDKPVVPVTDVFNLAQGTPNNGYFNSTYDKFPRLDNSSNFMSQNVTTFENINGGTVTVDSFIYPTRGTADNCTVGAGLLIYQAMCYKQANPEEEVYVDISAYRFSVQAAVNINRDSRYFGYMRNLAGTAEYDQYGFVRLSYLLISAAKMGIHVTAIGHADGYPVTDGTMNLEEYFTYYMDAPCDPAYVQDGLVGDYLNFCKVAWTLQNKGGTDMMHTKMCAVSHYLDMNGVAHQNAVWSSSSNLDGINASGTNGNWKLQTATIVSGHEAIYRTSVNYLRLIPLYQGQEEVYEFQNYVNRTSTVQAQMILAGQESEIPASEQIIYLGRDTDQVFELYFTPMGGEILAWDEVQNPYCKYLRKLYNSEDYIIFTWNAAEYSGNFPLGRQMENMIIAAFHENRDVRNKIYGNMEHFDTTTFDDLQVGVDIGVKNLNQWELGEVHNKDVQFSYVENGQRYYVSLLNSMNMHAGSMYYQSNFALVVKETELAEDSVFFTLADHTTTGIVEHAWSDEVLEHLPEDGSDGYTYHPCTICNDRKILDVVHRVSDWIVVQDATPTQNGVAHRSCTACGLLIEAREFLHPGEDTVLDLSSTTGETFGNVIRPHNRLDITSTPLTIEATLQLDYSVAIRGGIVVGNYDNSENDQLNLEIYEYGRPRLYLSTNGQRLSHIFNTDIRSSDAVHLAITVEGRTAKLYLNGQLRETAELSLDMPVLSGQMVIGGDNRKGNPYYFQGTIYNVALFNDVRTAAEIKLDSVAVFPDEEGLMAYKYYFRDPATATVIEPEGILFTPDSQILTGKLSETPLTMEALIQVPKSMEGRAGTIMGNYNGLAGNHINLEVYEGGKIRLYVRNGTGSNTYLFPTDIRSDKPVHIAVTMNGLIASLYVNGELSATQTMAELVPYSTDSMRIGGDNRYGNTMYFKGRIYSVSLFGCARTAEQIRSDMVMVSNNSDCLLYARRLEPDNKAGTQVVGGQMFTATTAHQIGYISATPKTLEATIQFSNPTARTGVIVGNFDGLMHGLMNLELYTNGRVRLYYAADDGTRQDCIFDSNVFSAATTHIAVTIDGMAATLYVNGQAVQTKTLTVVPGTATDNWRIGGDNRTGNDRYFRGSIYNVSLFADVRTPEEIRADVSGVSQNAEDLLYTHSFGASVNVAPQDILPAGTTFSTTSKLPAGDLAATPLTMEAVIQLDKSINGRGGVVIGDYYGLFEESLNLEIFYNGRPRLFYSATDGTRGRLNFDTDIRADHPVHIAVTIDGMTASLYVDGILKEQKAMPIALPVVTEDFKIGHDNRQGNAQYFKGTIYSASMFRNVRTPEQIAQDLVHVDMNDPDLLYNAMFVSDVCAQNLHVADAPVVDATVTSTTCGIRHTNCSICNQLLQVWRTPYATEFTNLRNYQNALGIAPSADKVSVALEPLPHAPRTFEATIHLSTLYYTRAGVIMGNYDGSTGDQINLEVYSNGNPRLYYKVGGKAYSYLFYTDIRSDKPVHLALTVDGLKATLYLDGVKKQTITLTVPMPDCTDGFFVGKDNRNGTQQYFAGTIYSAAMYSSVRTAQQIKIDRYLSCSTEPALMFDLFFPGNEENQ